MSWIGTMQMPWQLGVLAYIAVWSVGALAMVYVIERWLSPTHKVFWEWDSPIPFIVTALWPIAIPLVAFVMGLVKAGQRVLGLARKHRED